MDTGTLFLLGQGLKTGATVGGGFTARDEGRTKQRIANYEADGYARQGQEELAAAQRQAFEQRKKADRVISTQVARGAASGSALSSPDLLDLIGDTAAEGEYRAGAEMYGGYQRKAGLTDKANVRRAEGQAARLKGDNALIGTILEGGSDLAVGLSTYRRNYGSNTGGWRTTYRYG